MRSLARASVIGLVAVAAVAVVTVVGIDPAAATTIGSTLAEVDTLIL